MVWCRTFGCLPEPGAFLDQPADLIVRWRQYRAIEIDVANTKAQLGASSS